MTVAPEIARSGCQVPGRGRPRAGRGEPSPAAPRKANVRETLRNMNFWEVQLEVTGNTRYPRNKKKKVFPAWERRGACRAPPATQGAPAGPAEGPSPGGRAGGPPKSPGVGSLPRRRGRGGTPRDGALRGGEAERTAAAPGGAAPGGAAAAAAYFLSGPRRRPRAAVVPPGGTMTQRREPRPAAPLDEELEALG